eukprot:4280541-Alexandrium_andersonii.AAC.1
MRVAEATLQAAACGPVRLEVGPTRAVEPGLVLHLDAHEGLLSCGRQARQGRRWWGDLQRGVWQAP